jgi:hypothetical protein
MSGGSIQPSLLGGYYNPAEQKKAMLKQALLGAGLGMLQGGIGSTGQVIGQGLTGGLQGAATAKEDHLKQAMFQRELQQQNEKTIRENQERQRAEAERARRDKWINDQSNGMTPQQRAYAQVDQQGAMTQYGQNVFAQPKAPEAPKVETLYNDSGQQYKGQWNPQTGKWDQVGGVKPPENGITITNPDGTTTVIGGSGGKMTEGDHKAKLLAQQIVGQEKELMDGFDSLATIGNSIPSVVGGRGMQSGKAQVSEDALKNVVANWLYLTSGATATPSEVERQFSIIRPSPLDGKDAIIAKKARLQSIINSMRVRGNVPDAKNSSDNMSDDQLLQMYGG